MVEPQLTLTNMSGVDPYLPVFTFLICGHASNTRMLRICVFNFRPTGGALCLLAIAFLSYGSRYMGKQSVCLYVLKLKEVKERQNWY